MKVKISDLPYRVRVQFNYELHFKEWQRLCDVAIDVCGFDVKDEIWRTNNEYFLFRNERDAIVFALRIPTQ
jgi:hypothetical protein